MGTADLDKRTVEVAYARWAPIYDAVCASAMVKGLAPRVRPAARFLRSAPGCRSTNMTSRPKSPVYLCVPMLKKARANIASGRYPHIKDVILLERRKVAPLGVNTLTCFERTATLLAA